MSKKECLCDGSGWWSNCFDQYFRCDCGKAEPETVCKHKWIKTCEKCGVSHQQV